MNDRGAIVAPAVDTVFGASVAEAAPAAAGEPSKARAAPAGHAAIVDAEARGAVSRTLVTAAAAGQLSPTQKQTLAQIVAERTGLSQAEAEKRVNQAYADAQKALETARKATVLTGLGTVTALLVGLLAAWYAAQRGGHHRDNNIPARVVWSRRATVGIR
jgi:ParB-like chromosome segregation protein Spo0J